MDITVTKYMYLTSHSKQVGSQMFQYFVLIYPGYFSLTVYDK
jgi:hypothetical protein